MYVGRMKVISIARSKSAVRIAAIPALALADGVFFAKDGIAPGYDMILVRLTKRSRETVQGFFAGISGAPVYIGDRLGQLPALLFALALLATASAAPPALVVRRRKS